MGADWKAEKVSDAVTAIERTGRLSIGAREERTTWSTCKHVLCIPQYNLERWLQGNGVGSNEDRWQTNNDKSR